MVLDEKLGETTHVVFTQSGAGTLRQRISEAGFLPKVLCLWDNLSLGPLDCTYGARSAWFVEMFDGVDWSEIIQQRRAFWESAAQIIGSCCVWFSRKDTRDYCGYLEWVSKSHSLVHEVVEADDPIGLINPSLEWLKNFAQARVADRDRLSEEARNWSRLISENAPVRKIENGKIISASLDCYDELLLAKATADWKSGALIVGEVLGNDFEEVWQAGDLLLVNRLWALVDAGKLEARGDHSSIRSVQMRMRRS